ncbi:MAG TPA: ACT domain-containing protein [Firmicutes bacterium]|nr:ACT domain-containing protein [Bacillota bacterium]
MDDGYEVIKTKEKEHVVVTVMGSDRIGIVAAVSNALSGCNANIVDISQTIMQGIFAMILVVDISAAKCDLLGLEDILNKVGAELGVKIVVQHQDIFRYMHRI